MTGRGGGTRERGEWPRGEPHSLSPTYPLMIIMTAYVCCPQEILARISAHLKFRDCVADAGTGNTGNKNP